MLLDSASDFFTQQKNQQNPCSDMDNMAGNTPTLRSGLRSGQV